MYESFYQLTTNPFRLAPDPKFCFSHSGYKRAMEYLEYALDQGEGFVMVTGRPGTGKTLLVETFLNETDISRVVARRIAVSNHGAVDLLRAVAYAYGISAADMDKATMRHEIQQYFVYQEQAGRRVLLIVDEAQTLQHAALEELRILADLQTQSRLMMQLFLVGQESLQDLMHTPEMEQFQQRVIANYHLVPLNLIDARAYIQHRLLQAGWSGDPDFTGEAVLSVYQLSKGVPRHINKICNRLLLLGFGKGRHTCDKQDVEAISQEMREELLTPIRSSRTRSIDAESINTIPEIRDGRITVSELAIRADKTDASITAISEASRLLAEKRKQFIRRHPEKYRDMNLPYASTAASPTGSEADPGATRGRTRMPGYASPLSDSAAGKKPNRFRWKESLVITAAVLAITTIYIAALPTILGKSAGRGKLSHSDSQLAVIQDTGNTVLPGPAGDDAIADDLVTETAPVTIAVPTPVAAADEQRAIANGPEGQISVTSYQSSSTAGVVKEKTAPVVTPRSNRAINPQDRPSPAGESAVPAGEVNGSPASEPTGQYTVLASVEDVPFEDTPVEAEQAEVAAVEDAPVEETPYEVVPLLVDTSHEDKIAALLAAGERLIGKYQLLTPVDDNAYSYYLEVLRLDPGNEDARAGIQKIVDSYVILIRMAINRLENERARVYLWRGLSIQPGNRELLALKDALNRESIPAPASRVPVVQSEIEPQSLVTETEESTEEDLFSRINTFFKNRKADAIKGDVKVPTGWDG
jgi:type II secretory pathway predicted ATPase ExeA